MLPVSAIILNGKHRGVMIVDPEDYEAVWRYNWIADAFGGDRSREFYVNALIPELGTRKNLAHFLTGWPRTGHINGDTFDNRRVNLCRVDQGKYKAAMHPWGTKSRFKGLYNLDLPAVRRFQVPGSPGTGGGRAAAAVTDHQATNRKGTSMNRYDGVLLPILDVVRILRLPSSQALWNMVRQGDVFPVVWDKGVHAIPQAAVVAYLHTALKETQAADTEDPITDDSPYDYGRAGAAVRRMIDSGTLKPGDRLPVKQTATDCGVSTDSIRRAFGILARQRYLHQRIGTGWFVAARKDTTGG